jgi:metal-sulfur cluster biosynthetic enzyme
VDSTTTTVAEIHRILDGIIDPCSVSHGVPMGIEEMGLVRSVDIDDDGHVVVDMRLTSPCCLMVGHFSIETKARVGALPGVRSVEFRHDTGMEWTPSMIAPAAEARRRLALQVVRRPA